MLRRVFTILTLTGILAGTGVLVANANIRSTVRLRRKKSLLSYSMVVVETPCGPAIAKCQPQEPLDFESACFEADVLQVDGYRGVLPYRRFVYPRYLTPDVHFRWSAQHIIDSNQWHAQSICTPVRFCPDISNISLSNEE